MKCPKCKKPMEEYEGDGYDDLPEFYFCTNEKCYYYGIKRINKAWFYEE